MAAPASEPISVDVTRLEVTPNLCPIDAPLQLTIDFSAGAPVPSAVWEVKYVLDTAAKRHVLELGSSDPTDYANGSNSFAFKIDKLDVAGIKPSLLLNVGLLTATLRSAETEVIEIKMVTQVSKTKEGVLVRNVLNPLE